MADQAKQRSRDVDLAQTNAKQASKIKDLDRLAWLLDNSIRLPGGYRVGVDGLIGLIPGFGDAVGVLFALYIVRRASAFGVPKSVLGRMLLNVGLEGAIGAIPVVGDLFDFAFKANHRNMKLLHRYAEDAAHERRVSRLLLLAVAALAILFAVGIVALGVALAQWLFTAFE